MFLWFHKLSSQSNCSTKHHYVYNCSNEPQQHVANQKLTLVAEHDAIKSVKQTFSQSKTQPTSPINERKAHNTHTRPNIVFPRITFRRSKTVSDVIHEPHLSTPKSNKFADKNVNIYNLNYSVHGAMDSSTFTSKSPSEFDTFTPSFSSNKIKPQISRARSLILSDFEFGGQQRSTGHLFIQRSTIVPAKFSVSEDAVALIRHASFIRAGLIVDPNDPTNLESVEINPSMYNTKWYILGCSLLCFSATFHCLFSISALEDVVENYFDDLNSAQFASFGTVSFSAAMFISIIIPYFINKYDLYRIIIFAQCCVMIGQLCTVLAYLFKHQTLLYLGRFCIGTGLGTDSVSIQALTGLWFRGSQKQTLAFALVGNSIEIGISTAMFVLIPIYNYTHSLLIPFCVGLFWSLLSIVAACYMLYIEYQLNKIRTMEDKNAMKIDSNFREAFSIINQDVNKIIIYGIIIILFTCKCIADILFYESQSAYIDIFGLKDNVSDMIVSLPSILGLTVGALLGYIIGKFEQLSMTLIIATFLITVGLLILAANSDVPWLNVFGNVAENGNSNILPWVATGLYAFGLEMFFITGFSSLFQIIPVSVMSVASSLVSILTYGTSMINTYIFGVIADVGNFSYAFVFLACVSLCGGFFCSIVIHCVDGANERNLRKL